MMKTSADYSGPSAARATHAQTLTDAAREACYAEGVEFRDVPADGQWHRADLADDPHGKDDASIKLFADGEGGMLRNWKTGELVSFWARQETRLNPAELEARRKRQEAERQAAKKEHERQWSQAAKKARADWQSYGPASPSLPQLAGKGILDAYGCKVTPDGRLATPVYGADDQIQAIQYRHADGQKRNFKDAKMEGGFWWIGTPAPDGDLPILIATSFSTAASIYQAMGGQCLVYITYGDSGLEAVGRIAKARHPGRTILLCGDDDVGKPGNPGRTKAEAVSKVLALPVVFPDFGPNRPNGTTDFNDLAATAGPEAVQQQIAAALAGVSGAEVAPKPERPGDDARPVVKIIGGTLHKQVEAAEAALITSGIPIYQRNGDIVRPVRLSAGMDEGGVSMPFGAMILVTVDKHWAAKAMTRAARFERYDTRSKETKVMDCPMKISETWLSSVGDWKVPPIIGISECPTMRRDGSLILNSGYDQRSGIFVDYHGLEVSVIENPTRQDALDALEILKEPFKDFPFVDEASRSVSLSGALTVVVRRSLRTAPMHAADAPTKGSGKGLWANTIAMIGTGRAAAMVSQGRDEAEDEKRLSSMLMRSAPVICIDNIERNLQGDFLCTMLTESIVSPRILGFSKTVDIPTNSLVLATGNNMIFAGDMTRRVLPCRIDPECERPDARRFAINLRQWVPENRHRLIGAALTILRAYHVAGRPAQDILPYGSFEEWSDFVRSALVWLGCADPCLTRENLEKNDPITAQLAAVLPLWHAAFGATGKTTAEVAEAACGLSIHADLKHALLEVAASARNPDAIDPKKLGKWLKKFEKRVQDGLRIEKAGEDSHAKIAFWRIARVANNAGFAGNDSYPTRKIGSANANDGMTNNVGDAETNPANPAKFASSIAADREVL